MWEKELIDILEKEEKLLTTILEKENEKKRCLINRELDKILEINSEEEKIFLEIEKYEFARNEIVKRVSNKLNLSSEEITISRIIEFASNKPLIEKLKNNIISIISEIKNVSFENKVLIESSINISLSIIEKFTNTKASENTYNSQGKKEVKINLTNYSTIT
ncbi:MAG: flagellar export chaperone FlgN [Brevinematia bacterium]